MKTYFPVLVLIALLLLTLPFPARSSEMENSTELDIERGPGWANREFQIESSPQLETSWKGFEFEVDCSHVTKIRTNKSQSLKKLKSAAKELEPSEKTNAQKLLSSLEVITCEVNEIAGLSKPISIEKLEDMTEVMVEEYEEKVIEPLEGEVRGRKKARVLNIAERMEKIIDYLEYIMMKVRLYARKELEPKIAYLLREALLAATHGDEEEYINLLLKLFSEVEQNKGSEIKKESALRILNKLDYLLRKEGGETKDKEIEAGIQKKTEGADIELELENSSVASPDPSGKKEKHSFSVELERKLSKGEIELSYTGKNRDYLHHLSNYKDRRSKKVELQATKGIGKIDLRGNLGWKYQLYPNKIGDAVAPNREERKKEMTEKLLRWIEKTKLSPEVIDDLVSILQEAIQAIEDERHEDAVDELEDCLDEAKDYEWEGKIDSKQTEKIREKILAILPRKSRKTKVLKGSFSYPVGNDRQKFSVFKKTKNYPNNRDLSREKIIHKIKLKKSLNDYSCKARWKKAEKFYPRAKYKNRETTQSELDVALEKGEFRWNGELSIEKKNYPHQKDRCELSNSQKLVTKWKGKAKGIKITLQEEFTRFPHDRLKKGERRKEGEIELKADSKYGKLKISSKFKKEKEKYARAERAEEEKETSFVLSFQMKETGHWSVKVEAEREKESHPYQREEDEEKDSLEFLFSWYF